MEKYTKALHQKLFGSLSPSEVEKLIEKYLKGLSEEQAEIAMHFNGPLLVIAGPGSGKTETMVRRTALLIDHYKVDPSEILMTTFTEKAAANLVARVKSKIADPRLVEQITIGTIHSVCLKILEDFGVQEGVFTRSLRILDEHRGSLFIFNNFEELGLKDFYDKPTANNISAMISFYSSLQEKGTDVAKLAKKLDGKESDDDLKAAIATYPKYLELLKTNQALDFSSILLRTYELVSERPEILEKIRAKFKYIIVDEYQDTNPLQDKILRLIAEPKNNIVVIGDDDQSLYRFRGATVANFLEFDKRVPNCVVKKLSENRRSTKEILEISRLVVDKIPKEGRAEKKLETKNEQGQPITITAYETDEDEVIGIAETISQLYNTGKITSYSDVAVLCYSLSSIFGVLKEQLDARGIPFITKGDKSFSGQIAVQQIVKLMYFATGAKGRVKDLSVCMAPAFYFVSKNSYEEAKAISFEADITEAITRVEDVKISSPHDRKKVFELISLRKRIIDSRWSKKEYSDLLDLFFQILKISEAIKSLSLENSSVEAEEVLDQLGTFSQLISDYSNETLSRSYSDFNTFFSYIIRGALDNPSNVDDQNAVVIQTIHQSKGLEYPVVFMPSMVDSRFPSRRANDSSGIPYFAGVHKFWDREFKHENVDTDFRRILYVGITRAEKLLYLSYFKKKSRKAEPSRYIKELIDSQKITLVDEYIVPQDKLSIKTRHQKEKLRISSSHLQYYLFCPTRFKFALKHGLAAPHRGYFSFGSNLHSAIEEISNLVRTNGSEILKKVKPSDIFEKHWNNFGFDALGAEARQKEHAKKYFENFVSNQGKLLEQITVSEKKFTLEEPKFILTGKIDAIANLNQGAMVIDFKTGKRAKFDEEPECTFVDHQANIYVEAVERTTGEAPSGFYLHFLGEDQTKQEEFRRDFAVDKESRKKILSLLEDTVDRIEGNDFAPIREEERVQRCSLCEFRDVCAFRLRNKKAA